MSKKENTCAPFSEAGGKWTDSNNSKPRSDREKVPAGRGGDGVLGLQNAPPRKPRLHRRAPGSDGDPPLRRTESNATAHPLRKQTESLRLTAAYSVAKTSAVRNGGAPPNPVNLEQTLATPRGPRPEADPPARRRPSQVRSVETPSSPCP